MDAIEKLSKLLKFCKSPAMRRFRKVAEFCKSVLDNSGMSTIERFTKSAETLELRNAAKNFHEELELIFMMNEFM